MNRRVLGLFLLVCPACAEEEPVASDLPEGWEAAEPVEELVQRPCEDSAHGTDPQVSADLASDPLELEATAVQFRCGQAVRGWKQQFDEVEVLVQPIDMEPETIALCGCSYDLEVTVGSPESEPSSLVLWQRGDAVGGWTDPSEVGRVER